MNLTFKKQRKKIWSVDLNLKYSFDDIIKDLQNEDWQQKIGKTTGRRDFIKTPKSINLNAIRDYVLSDEAKRLIIDNFYSYKGIQHLYQGWSTDEMFRNTILKGRYNRCMQGYQLGPHLDHRLHVGTLIFYFTPKDIPEWSTYYYTSEDKKDELRIPTGYGLGACHINDYDTWHYAENHTNKPRFNLIIGLYLKSW